MDPAVDRLLILMNQVLSRWIHRGGRSQCSLSLLNYFQHRFSLTGVELLLLLSFLLPLLLLLLFLLLLMESVDAGSLLNYSQQLFPFIQRRLHLIPRSGAIASSQKK